MGKTLVTGGSGLIGSHLVHALVRRGDDVRVTVRRATNLENLADLEGEIETVSCELTDRRSVRSALEGVERVFHAAGSTSLRPKDAGALHRDNVVATRVLLECCLEADVERVVHTSSASALGPSEPGRTADERQVFTAGSLDVPYVNTKHEAEVEAMRLAARGLPLVCVNPCTVFGTGDVNRSSTAIVHMFLLGRIPAYVNGGVNIVDAEDVAAGQLLADRRGRVGERYVLGNRNYTMSRLFADLGRLSGMEPPALKLDPGVALRFAQALEALPGEPSITVDQVKVVSRWWTYSSEKAKRQLGYRPSHHEDTIEATVQWYMERAGDRYARARRSQPFEYKLAAAAYEGLRGVAGLARRAGLPVAVS